MCLTLVLLSKFVQNEDPFEEEEVAMHSLVPTQYLGEYDVHDEMKTLMNILKLRQMSTKIP